MKFILKKLPAILVAALIAAGIWWTYQRLSAERAGEAQAPIPTTTVSLGSIEDTVEAGGYVEPIISTEVRSEITGRIAEIFIEDGERVEAGQVLLELEKTERKTELEEAERLFAAQQLRLEQARRDYEREAALLEQAFTNEKAYLDARTQLELMQIDLAVRQARLEKSRDNLDKTTIRAPHAGIVGNLDLTPGQVITGATSVNQGTTLMTINDLQRLIVRTKVNELDISKVSEGMAVSVSFDALPQQEFEGTVEQIFSYAEREGNERVFRVLVSFEARGQLVRPGISAVVAIPVASAIDVPTVLPTGLFKEGDGFVAYRQTASGGWERVSVETGISSPVRVEIRSGLLVGDEVALTLPEAFTSNRPE